MPTWQPYGGWGWPAACLLPPSAVSLFATVLLKLEGSQRGVRWGTLRLAVTSQFPFSAATVFSVLAFDVLFYGALTWYLDRVSMPSSSCAPSYCSAGWLDLNDGYTLGSISAVWKHALVSTPRAVAFPGMFPPLRVEEL